jgi:hypothetical protein
MYSRMPTGIYQRHVLRHAVKQPLREAYRFIPLTRGQTAIVDLEDFDRLSQWHWLAQWDETTKTFYAKRFVRMEGGKRRAIRMHSEILYCEAGKIPDHIDGNGLNNRRDNLRKSTPAQNSSNRTKNVNNTSGFKGVYRFGRDWAASIGVKRRRIFLGYFKSSKQAAQAYDEAAKKYHGEFAVLNFKSCQLLHRDASR